jgi:SAM-dependent methyltransferase
VADHPLLAPTYDHLLAIREARGLSGRRRELLAEARGRVLEVAAGAGLNLAHYPPGTVSSVVALEPDAGLRRRLVSRVDAGACPVPCQVIGAGVEDAVFEDGSFDTVVCTLALCTVADPAAAAAAFRCWLAPGGRLLFLEHVRAIGLAGRMQRVADPLWKRASGGCHLDRDTLSVLRAADFAITDCRRFPMPAGGVLLSACVLGVARRRPVAAEVASP